MSVLIDCVLHPVLQICHISVHTVSTLARAAYSPAHRAYQIPLLILRTNQRSSTISLASVNPSFGVPCTAHAR